MNLEKKMTVDVLNSLSKREAEQWFSQCCAANTWAQSMEKGRPYKRLSAIFDTAEKNWSKCNTQDFLAAFEAHPMIGDVNSLRKKFATTKAIASNEQQGANNADEETLEALGAANHQYLEKHGFIFIICATGLSAQTMLEALLARLTNDTATEIKLAAAEQIKITLLRLEKGLSESKESEK